MNESMRRYLDEDWNEDREERERAEERKGREEQPRRQSDQRRQAAKEWGRSMFKYHKQRRREGRSD